jgi:hypothetical protein
MRSITSLAAVIVLAGSFTAHAQNTQGSVSPSNSRPIHHSKASNKTTNRSEAAALLGEDIPGMLNPVMPKGSAGARLPNYFPNCDEPIVPRFCPR